MYGQLHFPRMVRPIEYSDPLPLEEVAVLAGHEILMKVDGNFFKDCWQSTKDFRQQLRPHTVSLLIKVIIILKLISLNYFKT